MFVLSTDINMDHPTGAKFQKLVQNALHPFSDKIDHHLQFCILQKIKILTLAI